MNDRDRQIIEALRHLDPAPARTPLTTSESQRAAASAERIIASEPGVSPARPTRTRRRWVWASAVAAVAAAVIVPSLLGGDEAYADWSPVPVALTPAESAAAATACLDSLGQTADPGVEPLLAERRGGWTYVLIQPSTDVESSCVMPSADIADPPRRNRRAWFQSTGDPLGEPAPRGDQLREHGAMVGTTEEGLLSYSQGSVGRDVVGVTFTTPRGVVVKASVANGRYAVWWPAGRNDLRNPEIGGAATIDVSLGDGTTYRRPR